MRTLTFHKYSGSYPMNLHHSTNILSDSEITSLMDTDPAIALAHKARLMNVEGKFNLAIDFIDQSLTHRDTSLAYFARAVSKEKMADRDGAIADYSKAIELDPSFGLTYYNRVSLWERIGNNDGAMADCDKSIELGYKIFI